MKFLETTMKNAQVSKRRKKITLNSLTEGDFYIVS